MRITLLLASKSKVDDPSPFSERTSRRDEAIAGVGLYANQAAIAKIQEHPVTARYAVSAKNQYEGSRAFLALLPDGIIPEIMRFVIPELLQSHDFCRHRGWSKAHARTDQNEAIRGGFEVIHL